MRSRYPLEVLALEAFGCCLLACTSKSSAALPLFPAGQRLLRHPYHIEVASLFRVNDQLACSSERGHGDLSFGLIMLNCWCGVAIYLVVYFLWKSLFNLLCGFRPKAKLMLLPIKSA